MAQIDEYCGFCGGKEEFKVYLYGPYCKRRNTVKKINYCLALNLSENESLSKYICYRCTGDVEKFYNFRMLVNKTFMERSAKKSNEFGSFSAANLWDSSVYSGEEESESENFDLSFIRKSRNGNNNNNNCSKKAKSGSVSDMFPSLLSVRTEKDRPLSNVNLNLDGSKEKEENTRTALRNIRQAIMGADDLIDQHSSAKNKKRLRSQKMDNSRSKSQKMSADLFETQSSSAFNFSESLNFSDWNNSLNNNKRT